MKFALTLAVFLNFTCAAFADDGVTDIGGAFDKSNSSIDISGYVRGTEHAEQASGKSVPVKAAKSQHHEASAIRSLWVAPDDATFGCKTLKGVQLKRSCSIVSAACGMASMATHGDGVAIRREVDASTGKATQDIALSSCTPQPSSPGVEAAPLPVVTQQDFQSMAIKPLESFIGPPGQWVPMSIDVVVYAKSEPQTIETDMLGHRVQVRATPVRYRWDFGDGTVLTTTFPGSPYPKKDIWMRYKHEGWYEAHLTTEFVGEFSVDGGPFRPISGSVFVDSPSQWLYSDARKARLVAEPGDPSELVLPERTAETMGKSNKKAKKKTLTKPMKPKTTTSNQ